MKTFDEWRISWAVVNFDLIKASWCSYFELIKEHCYDPKHSIVHRSQLLTLNCTQTAASLLDLGFQPILAVLDGHIFVKNRLPVGALWGTSFIWRRFVQMPLHMPSELASKAVSVAR